MNTGERIRLQRKKLGLSADYVADKLGVSRSTIFRYENGDIEKLPIDILEPISKILQTTPSYLMGWEDEINYILEANPINSEVAYAIYQLSEGNTFNDLLKQLKEDKVPIEHHENIKAIYSILNNNSGENLSENSLKVAKAYDKADDNKKKIVELTLDLDFSENNEYILNAAHEIKGSTDEDKKHDDELMNDDNF